MINQQTAKLMQNWDSNSEREEYTRKIRHVDQSTGKRLLLSTHDIFLLASQLRNAGYPQISHGNGTLEAQILPVHTQTRQIRRFFNLAKK